MPDYCGSWIAKPHLLPRPFDLGVCKAWCVNIAPSLPPDAMLQGSVIPSSIAINFHRDSSLFSSPLLPFLTLASYFRFLQFTPSVFVFLPIALSL